MIAMDCHKRYTFACVQSRDGRPIREQRIEHRRGNIRAFLSAYTPGSPVALETIGNWYWIVDEIEQAEMVPRLVNARKAKLMLGSINKTDKLDARGLNRLQQVGVLPTVWIPPGELRDQRELPRTRMVFGTARTRLKNRIHSVALNWASHPHRHVSKRYVRIRHRRGHATAIGAVARHLAEATYWMLAKNEPYKERGIPEVSSRGA